MNKGTWQAAVAPMPPIYAPLPDISRVHVADGAFLHSAGFSDNENYLVNAALAAYNHHCPLVLTPDDLMLPLIQAVSVHVAQHPDVFRDLFTESLDKAELIVETPLHPTSIEFVETCLDMFRVKLREHMPAGSTADLLTPKFTTTSPVHTNAYELALMDAAQSYYDFGVVTMCGIASVTLEGTDEDWVRWAEHATALLDKFFLRVGAAHPAWVAKMNRVIAKIIDPATPPEWWTAILFELRETSGRVMDTYRGWLTNFFPYEVDATSIKKRSNGKLVFVGDESDDEYPERGCETIPRSVRTLPVKHRFEWETTTTTLSVCSGQCGVAQQQQAPFAVSVAWGYAMRPGTHQPIQEKVRAFPAQGR